MKRKNCFSTLAVAALAAMAMTSCDKSKSQVDDKQQRRLPLAPLRLPSWKWTA